MTVSLAKAPGQRSSAQKQDDSIMGTNNSSIVSKRSVERLYYPDEPHFFRYFVKKPQRRSPLINRGYWLRMRAIDDAVRRFLEDTTISKTKVVINLGAGYDPLPWQCFTRYPEACKGVKFIDIDYPDLMRRKRATVVSTPELSSMLTNVVPEGINDRILYKSDQYLQLGCDLRVTQKVSEALSSVIDLDSCLILFTAEVSITYMTLQGADALLRWAATLPSARFCLLEQLMPQGNQHPFAKTMMAHFNKLGTPLHSVAKYPTTTHQEERFKAAGWSQVRARNLWQLWASDDFLSSEERCAIDGVEPFDEWEEFALFGLHYFVLEARNDGVPYAMSATTIKQDSAASVELEATQGSSSGWITNGIYEVENPQNSLHISESRIETPPRRFGTCIELGKNIVGNFGGMGQSRLDTTAILTYGKQERIAKHARDTLITDKPSARMCHTITKLNDFEFMLVGGRVSPDKALVDCWIYDRQIGEWRRTHDLPVGLYRHSAVCITQSQMLVIFGGKVDSTHISDATYIWQETVGWRKISALHGHLPPPVFGATLCQQADPDTVGRGILCGGMLSDGTLQRDIWSWRVSYSDENRQLQLMWQRCRPSDMAGKHSNLYSRFGASLWEPEIGTVFLVGGVQSDALLGQDEEIVRIEVHDDVEDTRIVACKSPWSAGQLSERPLLIGLSIQPFPDHALVTGGGAVCFSFGTFWNSAAYTIRRRVYETEGLYVAPAPPDGGAPDDGSGWEYRETIELGVKSKCAKPTGITNAVEQAATVQIPRQTLSDALDFKRLVTIAQPVVFEKVDFGPCIEKWTDSYLTDQIGSDREVVIHRADTSQMDFLNKNFTYVKQKFGDFLAAVTAGERLYLRSLAAGKPSEEPANLKHDFSAIADDFQLPPQLSMVSGNAHSSPLRISGPVNMWLHYDVMANVLCQIRGTKRLLLFPPTDVTLLGFAGGASSSSIDVFASTTGNQLTGTHPHEVVMRPGDVLFIPPLWLHAAQPIDGVSISVNVFFRDMERGYAAGRDVYGNRDIQAYEKGRSDVKKIVDAFQDLPGDMRRFYLLRLAEEMRDAAV